MNNKTRPLFFICLGLLFGMAVMYIYNNFIADSKAENRKPVIEYGSTSGNQNSADPSIDELTNEKTVIQYVKQNHQLPNCYITKNEARKQGWNAAQGNLCEVLPGKAIGGDKFSNREKTLPQGVQYFEADVNYHCGNRNADRIVFTENGEVYLTKDHYKSFEKQ
ncbi:ribonuclease domain-containing protein [Chryseobacterium sp. MYb264]|uniref:ribonuclease domain-containing protein n=1 Tax=Chryseobacterium sp. MYb264 TaxID=2745153 RepID=UPI002E12C015|nr:ribonuclease domain-containing protein [Chryseobacterium sp. MYb264]